MTAAHKALMMQAWPPTSAGPVILFVLVDVPLIHLAGAISTKSPQNRPIATYCNCVPSALLACLACARPTNAVDCGPPPAHVELGP